MNKRRLLLIIIIVCVFLPIILFKYLELKSSKEYIDRALPFYAQDKWTNKIIYVESPKKIAQSMLAGEEYFKGDLKLSYLDIDKAEITMRNYGTGDDSMTAIEYYVISDRTQSGWKISQYKMHWKCRGLIFPNYWTTSGCL